MKENIIALFSDDGKKMEFEILASIDYEDNTYAVLYPTNGETDVYIVKVEDGIDDNTNIYTVVEDEQLVNKIYDIYKSSNPEGIVFDDNK